MDRFAAWGTQMQFLTGLNHNYVPAQHPDRVLLVTSTSSSGQTQDKSQARSQDHRRKESDPSPNRYAEKSTSSYQQDGKGEKQNSAQRRSGERKRKDRPFCPHCGGTHPTEGPCAFSVHPDYNPYSSIRFVDRQI